MRKSFNFSRYNRFFLYLIIVVLINVAGATLFVRLDLTANGIYSLSRASRDVVSTLSEPLTVKVFFTDNLPAPYNNIERYLGDLLEEYALAGNRYFNYEFINVSDKEGQKGSINRQMAQNYGINPVQIQKIEKDEVKFQTAYMGMVLIHGDIIETISTITSTEGIEFRITSAIRKMNNKISALLGLKEHIGITLFLSSSLEAVAPYMNIAGLSEVPEKVEAVINTLNEKNYGRLSFTHVDPSRNREKEEEAKTLGILSLKWDEFRDRRGKVIPADSGYAGIMVRYGERREDIPLIRVVRIPIFGTQYILTEKEDLERDVEDAIENIIDVNEKIGYLADHGTLPLGIPQVVPGHSGAESISRLNTLMSREYTVTPVNLKEHGIPEGLPSLIIAGPREPFSDYELYQIDQYLMKGRNLGIFMDALEESPPQGNMPMGRGQGPAVKPIDTGLERLLAHYGLKVEKTYILDENCFKQELPHAFGGGERPIYFAPIIKNEFINKNLAFLKNIKGLVMLKASPLAVAEDIVEESNLAAVKLFSSSRRAWKAGERISLNPMFMQPPSNEDDFGQMAMAYVLEGSFPSYFADKPVPAKEGEDEGKGETENGNAGNGKGSDTPAVLSAGVKIKRGKPGKIFLIGTSEILKNNVIDDEGKSPNAQFIMNVVDYLSGREDNAEMRTKAQRFNPLMDVTPGARTFIKTANVAGLPAFVVMAGVIVWFRRQKRKQALRDMFEKE